MATFGTYLGGNLANASDHAKIPSNLRQAVEVAQKLNCHCLTVQTGSEIEGIPRQQQHQSIVDGLKLAAEIAEPAGITLCLEPLNVLVDHRGYYLYTSEEAFQIIDEVGSMSVKVLYDIYHQQITEGNLIANIATNIDKIQHFHVADVPGRHEPGTGEINYRNVFKCIAETDYDGFIGLEFWPECPDDDALKMLLEMTAGL